MLTLTIEEKKQGIRLDAQVNSQQKMIETLKILEENGVLSVKTMCNEVKIKSARKKEYLHLGLSFEQNGIREGDILTIL